MDAYIGELQLFAFGYEPNDEDNILLCDGRILYVSQYSALFSLIGNQYGGDGQSTFALPNLNQASLCSINYFSRWYIATEGTYPERND